MNQKYPPLQIRALFLCFKKFLCIRGEAVEMMISKSIYKLGFYYSILYTLILISYLNSNLSAPFFGSIKYGILILSMALLLVFKGFKVSILNQNVKTIYILLICTFFYFTSLTLLSNFDKQVLLYIILTLFFISFLLVSVDVISKNALFETLIKINYFVILLFLIILFMANFTNLLDISVLKNSLSKNFRVRNSFGFYHPNTTGNICFLFLVNSFYFKKFINDKKLKILVFLSEAFAFLVMAHSGSRGAITSTIFFIVFYYSIKFLYRSNKLERIVLIIFVTILVFLTINNIIGTLEIEVLKESSSNRIDNWVFSIKYLLENNYFILGTGYLNPQYFYTNSQFNYLQSDNGYVYTLITTGIVGLCLLIIIIIKSVISLLTIKLKNDIDLVKKCYIVSFTITILYYNSVEIIYFNPSGITSLIYWLLLLSFLEETKKKTI
jgi:O-antigen ligase